MSADGSGPNPTTRYEITATVLDNGGGPELCAGSVATSLPPQCSGPPILGWDWSAVDHEAVSGVRWGDFHLVGTWDGKTFALTEPATTPTTRSDGSVSVDFSPPCPEPAGGWPTASVSFEQLQSFLAATAEPADFAGRWVDSRSRPADPGRGVYTVAYTGDIAAHRAQLEAIWPGPLCVVQFPHTLAELVTIQKDVTAPGTLAELGLNLLSSGVDEMRGTVMVGVLIAEPGAQAAFDERYGDGVVEIQSELRPLD